MVMKFKEWVSADEMFGVERPEMPKSSTKEDPLHGFDTERMIKYLAEFSLGERQSDIKFMSEVHWGKGPGAIRLYLGTNINVVIEKLHNDLNGVPKWITKKVFQVNRDGYGGYEEIVAEELLNHLEKINGQPLESPQNNYCTEEFETLIREMASRVRNQANPIMFLEGIKKVKDNYYIIHFGVRGQGVEAPGQRRVDQIQIEMTYSPDNGTIKLMSSNVESPVGGSQSWELMPMDFLARFTPTQSHDEIIETVINTFKYY